MYFGCKNEKRLGKVGRSWQSFVGGHYSLLNGNSATLTRNNFPLPSSTDDHNSLNSPPLLQICCGLCQILLSAANNTTHTKSYQRDTSKQLDILPSNVNIIFMWTNVFLWTFGTYRPCMYQKYYSITGCFLHWASPKMVKYRKSRLGEYTLT